MQLKCFALLPLLISSICFAQQRLPIKEGGKATISVSGVGLNRIAVEEDRILSVKGISGQFQMDKDDKLGQIFIQPTIHDKGELIHLFITTEKGATYSLSLLVSDLAPESIVLVPEIPAHKEIWEHASDYEVMITRLIKVMHHGTSLKGFSTEGINKREKDIKKTKVTQLKQYHGGNMSGHSYEIFNDQQDTILLEEKDFYHHGVRAVAILNKNLKPQQKTLVYIIK